MRSRLQVATIDNRPLRDISDQIDSGKVTVNEASATAWSLKCELLEPVNLIPWHEFLAPSMDVIYDDGTVLRSQMGLYVVVPPPKRHRQEATEIVIDGRDLTALVQADAFEDTYSIAPEDDPIEEVTAILVGTGISEGRISFPAKSTPENTAEAPPVIHAARDWELGTPKLTIVNDILEMIGYYALFADETGVLGSIPYRNLETATADQRYASGPGSRITGEITEDAPSMTSFANVVVVTAGNPSTADALVPTDTESPSIADGRTVRVTADIGLRLRDAAGLSAPILRVMPKGTGAVVTGTSTTTDGYTWWPITATIPGVGERSGWSAGNWLEVVPGDPDPAVDPLRPPIVAIRRNDDPSSPVSIQTIGRKVRWERPSDIETQAQADELADRLIAESLTYSQKLTLRTLPDSRRRMHEIYDLDVKRRDGTPVASGRWRCTGWDVGFTPNEGVMTHTCYRIQAWAKAEVDG